MTQATYRTFTGSAAEKYERWFVPLIPAALVGDLLDRAALEPGETVLDVACGTGIVARSAAEQVGPTGRVVGVDLAPDMLALARSLSTASGTPIEWQEGNAEALPFDDSSFDVVLSQLGLMFVEDKPAAAREMRRVLADGGRLALNVAGRIQSLYVVMGEALARHIDPALEGFMHAVFSLHDPHAVEALLSEAGFRDVEVREVIKTLRLPAPAEFLGQYIAATPMSTFVDQAPPGAYAALEAECVERWQPFVDGDGMVYDQPIVVATARA